MKIAPTRVLLRVAAPSAALLLLAAAGCRSTPGPAASAAPAAAAPVAAPVPRQPVFNLASYGAVADGKTLNTEAFRRAIADCRQAGGGIVEVPAGRYLTGPVDLVSRMTLQLDPGSVMLFDTDRAEYPEIQSRWEGVTAMGPRPLLFADGLHDIAIVGSGTIDGQGSAWWQRFGARRPPGARPAIPPPGQAAAGGPLRAAGAGRPQRGRRPPLVQIRNCVGVRLDGPTFTNSPFWTVHLLYSSNIEMANCRMINPPISPNTDACDIDSCSHVLIHDCFADVGDDSFVIKSGRDEDGRKVNRPSEDITLLRCHVANAHGVGAIGSESSGGVRHVRILDCDGTGTEAGIRIKSTRGRGGVVEDVVASRIKLTNVRDAIILTMHYTQAPLEPVSERTPTLRDIHIDHVTETNVRNTCLITGLEERAIQDITLSDLDLNGENGVVCSYGQDITFRNVRISTRGPAYREDHSHNVQRIAWTELPYVAPAEGRVRPASWIDADILPASPSPGVIGP